MDENHARDRFADQVEELRRRYAAALPEKTSEVRQHWGKFSSASGDEDAGREMVALLHRLAGSGGTFGFPEISQYSRILEALVADLVAAGARPEIAQREQVEELLGDLERAAQSTPLPFVAPALTPDGEEKRPDLLIADADSAYAETLAEQLGNFGYRVRVCHSGLELSAAATESPPLLGLLDLDLEGSLSGVFLAIRINAESARPIPWFFLSKRDDLEARLRAIHAGGRAYFLKPVSLPDLLQALDDFTKSEQVEPYRVLIVEDDTAMARYSQFVLAQAGLEVRLLDRADAFLDTVSDFKPELVLMDLYLGNTIGTDLAQVLEQHDGYQNLPVVFLSAERDEKVRFDALEKGADNFLVKPINPTYLVQAIRSRVRRARQVGALVHRDGLTHLMNHRAIMSRMAVEVKRCQREGQPLSLSVIDIDRFKPVNDTHGHAVGDRVLQALSRMLMQRLRESDLIGRYGGEEFVVLLPNTTPAEALRVMDEVRGHFARVRHRSNEGVEFSVTFSGGIAGMPPRKDLQSLFDAADGALYAAKNDGRNRILLSSMEQGK